MFSYLLGNVNGIVAQMSVEEGLKQKQVEDLEEWLLKLDRVGKMKRIKNEDIDFITKYMNGYWWNSVKDMDKECQYIALLPPPIRRRVIPFDSLSIVAQSVFGVEDKRSIPLLL